MAEEWRDVVGYEGYYQVSNCGRIRRIKKSSGAIEGRILKPYRTPKGYLTVSLYHGHNYKITNKIHRLVATAFIGPPTRDKREIRHLDGNPDNNVVCNLAWGTNKDNKMDIIRHGRSLAPKNPSRGEKHGRAKLTEEQVWIILDMLPDHTQIQIAQMFGVKQAAISAIKTGKNWKHMQRR